MQQPASASTAASSTTNQTDSVSTENAVAEDNLHKITSPIVGTFYSSPSPDKEPYVKEGSVVSPETTVCIVEAMKLMNEIQAEVSGVIVKIYVENGQPVEYGQPLFGIKK
jgi:acetyl-CoA carboxylase biotin carboxyl carrier protein